MKDKTKGKNAEEREPGMRLSSDIDDIERIIDALHDRKVKIGGIGLVDFIDREEEARAVLEGVAEVNTSLSFDLIVLYGPSGCGKTELFSSLLESIDRVNRDRRSRTSFEAIIVGYEQEEEVREIQERVERLASIRWTDGATGIIKQALRDISKDLLKGLKPAIGLTGVSLNIDLSEAVSRIVHTIGQLKEVRGDGKILIALDEVRVSSETELEGFVKWLHGFTNTVASANEAYYKLKGGHIAVIALTSDALVAEARYRVGGKVGWILMWNLPREASERLADQLGIEEDRDLLWRLAGGNPRALTVIRRIGLARWLEIEIIRGVRIAITSFMEEAKRLGKSREWVWEQVIKASRDPDELSAEPIRRYLVSRNILIDVGGAYHKISSTPGKPIVGDDYAFQIPAYYYVFKAIARKGDLKISSGEVIDEAGRA